MRDCYTRMLNMNIPTYCVALLMPSAIDLVTVFDAILTNREKCEKLQCLYENLMSNNFRCEEIIYCYSVILLSLVKIGKANVEIIYSLVLTSFSRKQPVDLLSVNLFVKS